MERKLKGKYIVLNWEDLSSICRFKSRDLCKYSLIDQYRKNGDVDLTKEGVKCEYKNCPMAVLLLSEINIEPYKPNLSYIA